jgi:GDP-L-fucose synthase
MNKLDKNGAFIYHRSQSERIFNGAKNLLFLGSSCIYPKHAPQPMREEHLLAGALEPTNEPYAVAKIAGIKLCQSYNRQYGTDFIAVMPTNLCGTNDNYHPVDSHVLPGRLRQYSMPIENSHRQFSTIVE